MSVDLDKHKDQLQGAWKDVVDDKSDINWAVFGYEKQTTALMLIGKGDGGLEELLDELNSAKIMYAFCRVHDPNTSLTKYVFINWQGEGAPLAKKGSCASHVRDVANFFKGTHITINARTEDDIEPSAVMEKVSRSTGSKFNFSERSETNDNITPVGSVYKRIQPAKEINSREREKFWMKEQEEEKCRVEEERKKNEAEKSKLEQERRDREVNEAAKREQTVKERTMSITETREAEHNAENTARNVKFEKMQWERQMKEDVQEDEDRRRRSESLRRERSQEAQSLISKRTINARAIFEQNTCAGQMNSFQSSNSSNNSSNENVPSVVHSANAHPPPVASVAAPSALVVTSPVYNTETSQKVQEHIREDRLEKSEMTITLTQDSEELDQGYDVPSPAPPERPLPGSADVRSETTSQSIRSYESQFSYTRNLLKEGLPPRQESEMDDEEQNWDEAPPDVKDPLREMLVEHGITPPTSSSGSQQPSPQIITSAVNSTANEGLKARALYDYQAADDTEISFDPDDLITHIEQIDEGWWQGMGPDGTYGLFPANYVELVE